MQPVTAVARLFPSERILSSKARIRTLRGALSAN
jgi:hypothetical protein